MTLNIKRPDFSRIPNIGALLRGHFFSGLLVLTPLAVIVWIGTVLIGMLWDLRQLVPDNWQPEHLFSDPSTATFFSILILLGIILVLSLVISFTGWASKQILGRKVFEFVGELIQHIPILRSIYSALDQLTKTMGSSGGSEQFSRVVYIEYPRLGVWTLAFVTGSAKSPAFTKPMLNVFVPTTPNPTSGFYLIVPESEVKDSGMRVEEAFKTLLSLGLAQPNVPTSQSSTDARASSGGVPK